MKLATFEQNFWQLRSGEADHKEYPETFWIPDLADRTSLQIGDSARLIFEIEGCDEQGQIDIIGERMNVIVSEIIGDYYLGILDHQPYSIDPEDDFYLGYGVEILFKAEHVINISRTDEDYIKWQLGQKPEKCWPR